MPFISSSSFSLLYEQMEKWSKLGTSLRKSYKPVMSLSKAPAKTTKKIFEIKDRNEFVVLKQFDWKSDPLCRDHFIREVFVGSFLESSGLQTFSRYFFTENVSPHLVYFFWAIIDNLNSCVV